MKTKSIIASALALVMMAASCQKEPVGTPEGETPEGTSYVALNISLPAALDVKAADGNPGHNDNFDDGVEDEYKINDYTVIFYANEKYAEHFSYNTKNTTAEDVIDNITATFTMGPVEIKNGNINSALVLINAKTLFPNTSDYKLDYAAMQEKIFSNQTNAENITGAGNDNFFMSNALQWDGSKFYSLVTVTPKKTEAEATATAAKIQVERAAAKVQVAYTSTEGAYKVGAENNQVTILGWEIDNTNKSFYPVRQGDANWYTTAFVNLGLYSNSSKRVYYAVDPNYNTTIADVEFVNNFNLIGTPADDYTWRTSGAFTYCLENTFSKEFMKNGYTTRVVFKAKYLPTNPKYGTSEYSLPDETWFMVGAGQQPYSEKALKEAITAAGDPVPGSWTTDATGRVTNLGTNADAALGDVYYFKGGICYYPAYIRHFLASEHKTATEGFATEEAWKTNFASTGAYADYDLGRYGIVRNNWYKLTLNSLSAPGSPVVPTPDPDTLDDLTKLYVDCDVQILAWNVRNHGIDL